MMFAEQWKCPECHWQNGFVRIKCRNCGCGRYHHDPDINKEIAGDIAAAKAWDEKHGIAPETRDDTL